MNFSLHCKDGIFEIKTFGIASVEGIHRFIKELLDHEEWEPGSRVLIDHTECDLGNLTVDEVDKIAELNGQLDALTGEAKCANVVARDLEFGMIRMWGFLVADRWAATEKVFRSRDEALEWLST